ncbi:hypothetical protein ABEO83_20130 [Bacillus glycinifermentans]
MNKIDKTIHTEIQYMIQFTKRFSKNKKDCDTMKDDMKGRYVYES